MMLLWEEVMKNCPFIKEMIESKIAEEVSKKDNEIQKLIDEKEGLQKQIDNLSLTILSKVGDNNA